MYPHLKDQLKVHYIDNYGIVMSNKTRLLSDIDIYIFDKLTGEKTIDNVIDEIAVELGAEERSQVEDVMNKFLEANEEILQYEESPASHTMRYTGERNMKYPSNFLISLTDSCNIRCMHCYKSCKIENKDFLPYDKLISILEKVNNKVPVIQLTGGEPMLYEGFFDILKYCKENFNVNVTTNGTLITEGNAPEFKGVSTVQVSLHSHKREAHEALTKVKGSYDKAVNGIKHLLKNNIDLSISMLANQNNINEIEDMIKFLIEIGVKKFSLSALSRCGRGLDLEEYWFLDDKYRKRVEDILMELGDKYKGQIEIEQWSDSSIEEEMEKDVEEENEEREGMKCGAGTLTWCISAKGNILPCDLFPEDLFSFGNILEKDIVEIVKGHNLDKFDDKVITWDSQLREINSSTKEICYKIEAFRKRKSKELMEA